MPTRHGCKVRNSSPGRRESRQEGLFKEKGCWNRGLSVLKMVAFCPSDTWGCSPFFSMEEGLTAAVLFLIGPRVLGNTC